MFIGRSEVEAETPILWPPDAKSLLTGKDPDAGRRKGRQKMRWPDGITNAMDKNLGKLREMVRARESACCSPWGHKELDMTGRLNLMILPPFG